MNQVVFLVAALTAFLLGMVHADCPHQSFNETDSVQLPKNATAGDTCVFTITRPSSDPAKFTTFVLKDVIMTMGTNDSFVIYDGPKEEKNKLLTIKDQIVLSQVAVTFSTVMTIEFYVGENDTKSSGSFDFTFGTCQQNLTDSWVLPVTSPLYLKNQGSFMCTYNVANALPADRRAVVSFSQYSLKGESYLALTSGSEKVNFTKSVLGSQVDFFTDASAIETVIQFKVVQNAVPQMFSLSFDAAINSCTEDITITNETTRELTLPSNPGAEYSCRLRVSVGSGEVMVNVTEAALAQQMDALTVLDGSSSNGKVASLLTDSATGYLVLSSQSELSLRLSLSSVQMERKMSLVFTPLAQGGRLVGSGQLHAGEDKPGTDDNAVDTVTTYFQLLADSGKQASVTLQTQLTGNTTLTFYNGLQMDQEVLAVLTADSQDLTTVVGGPSMLVVLADFPVNGNFTAAFTSISSGCDQLVTGLTAHLAYVASDGNQTQTCQWTLAPKASQGTIVLDLDVVSLGQGDSLNIYSGLTGQTVLAGYSAVPAVGPMLQIYIPAQTGARIVVQRAQTYHPEMRVAVHYRVVAQACGGALEAATGVLSTPNFPNQYPLNADCVWTRTVAEDSLLFLSLQSLSLASNHSLSVVDQENATSATTLVSYGGTAASDSELPADFIVPASNQTQFQFSSVDALPAGGAENPVGSGVQLKYWFLDCGGNISDANGTFSSPGYPSVTSKPTTCVWIVQLQGNSSEFIIDFNITVKGAEAKNIDKYLTVYDGPSLRSPVMPSARYSSDSRHTLSRYNSLVFLYSYTQTASVKDKVSFNVTFVTHECNATCDNGVCLHADWICNNVDDCGDNSDERHCVFVPTTQKPSPPPEQDYSGYVKSGWVAGCLFIGAVLGAAILFLTPRIIRRLRSGSSGSYNRMNDNSPVVA
ncbi:cubilin [Aplysia californica]|uniref:Cubilin n=1 Tax=Aplysia californica TaxID=6500 RepID=A0ABM1A6Y7_APLCA|nr:cubilin [Aplysia californica]